MNPVLGLCWYVLLGGWVAWMSRSTGLFRSWNTFTVFVTVLLIHHGMAVPFSWDAVDQAMSMHVTRDVRLVWLVNLLLMYFFLGLGAAVVNDVTAYRPGEGRDKRNSADPGANVLFLPMVLVGLGVVVMALSNASSGVSLAAYLFRTVAADEYAQARLAFGESFGSLGGPLSYIASLALYSLVPMAVVFFAMRARQARMYWLPVMGVTLLYLYVGLVSGQKYIAFGLLLTIFIGLQIHRHHMRLHIGVPIVALAAFIALAIFPYLYMAQYSTLTYWDALGAVWNRITLEPNRGLQLYYYFYPDLLDHLNGSSSGYAASLMGVTPAPPHTYLAHEMFGRPNTTWNVAFLGDAWADFGAIGTAAVSFVVGGILQAYNVWFARSARTMLQTAAFATLCASAVKLSGVGLPTALMTFGLGTTFLIYLVCCRWWPDQVAEISRDTGGRNNRPPSVTSPSGDYLS